MKIILTLLVSFATVFAGWSSPGNLSKPEEKELYVVLSNDANDPISKMLRHAVENVWTATKYKFITEAEFDKDFKDKQGILFLGKFEKEQWSDAFNTASNCAIHMFEFRVDQEGKDFKKGEIYRWYYVPQSGNKFWYRETTKSGKKVKSEKTWDRSQSDITFDVQFLQSKIKAGYDWAVYYKPGITTAAGHNPKANAVIHKKTLVLSQAEANLYNITEDKMKKQYDHPCKIVSNDEMDKMVESKDPEVVYLRSYGMFGEKKDGKPVNYKGNDWAYFYIVDAATGFVFYSEDNLQVSFVKAYLFRTLNK